MTTTHTPARRKRIARHKARRKLYKAADVRMGSSDWRDARGLSDSHPFWLSEWAWRREHHARFICKTVPMPKKLRHSQRVAEGRKAFERAVARWS